MMHVVVPSQEIAYSSSLRKEPSSSSSSTMSFPYLDPKSKDEDEPPPLLLVPEQGRRPNGTDPEGADGTDSDDGSRIDIINDTELDDLLRDYDDLLRDYKNEQSNIVKTLSFDDIPQSTVTSRGTNNDCTDRPPSDSNSHTSSMSYSKPNLGHKNDYDDDHNQTTGHLTMSTPRSIPQLARTMEVEEAKAEETDDFCPPDASQHVSDDCDHSDSGKKSNSSAANDDEEDKDRKEDEMGRGEEGDANVFHNRAVSMEEGAETEGTVARNVTNDGNQSDPMADRGGTGSSGAAVTDTGSSSLVEQLIKRQMAASRAMMEQEEVSFQLVQTLIQFQETIQRQEQELRQLRHQQRQSQPEQSDDSSNSFREKTPPISTSQPAELQQEEKERHDQEIQSYQDKLQQQREHIEDLVEQVKSLEAKCQEKDAMLKDRDAVIQMMEHQIPSLSLSMPRTLGQEQVEILPESFENDDDNKDNNCTSNVEGCPEDKDHHPQGDDDGVSSSLRLKQAKALREERLKDLMSRFRCRNKNSQPNNQGSPLNGTTTTTMDRTAEVDEDGDDHTVSVAAAKTTIALCPRQPEHSPVLHKHKQHQHWTTITPTISKDESNDTPPTEDHSSSSSSSSSSPASSSTSSSSSSSSFCQAWPRNRGNSSSAAVTPSTAIPPSPMVATSALHSSSVPQPQQKGPGCGFAGVLAEL